MKIPDWKIILFAIILLGGILRFFAIDQIPVSLYWDEASSTYNAYSILKTGKDEFGNPYPLLFRAFEDYKTPANIYLTVIPVMLFGLNEFSARFTSAFLGTLTILITFFLVKELFKNLKKIEMPFVKKKLEIDPKKLGILSALLLAISPWHIGFSRTGFEANVGLFFVVTGTWLFLRAINNFSFFRFTLSLVVYAVSIYFYRSIWVFVPLFLIALYLIHWKVLLSRENIKKTVLASIVFIVILLPFIPIMVSKEGLTRTRQVNIVSNSDNEVYDASKKLDQSPNILNKIIYNRRFVYVQMAIGNYFSHFLPPFLILQGDGNARHGAFGMGVLYWWELPFLIIGLLVIFRDQKRIRNILLAWILIAPIPAALSVPSPHALRSLNMLPAPQILISLGILAAFYMIPKNRRLLFSICLCVISLVLFVRYLHSYYVLTAKATGTDWADGYEQLITHTKSQEKNYDKILISGHYWQPYVYTLFYKEYSPQEFQQSGSKKGFDKYLFGGTSWDMQGQELGDVNLQKFSKGKKILIALSPLEYRGQQGKVIKIGEIRNQNNELMFILAEL